MTHAFSIFPKSNASHVEMFIYILRTEALVRDGLLLEVKHRDVKITFKGALIFSIKISLPHHPISYYCLNDMIFSWKLMLINSFFGKVNHDG